jgi:hypothetical protein
MDLKNKLSDIDVKALKSFATSTKGIIVIACTLIFLFGVYSIIQSLAPKRAPLLYAVCSGFLEQQVTFPKTLKHTAVEQYSKALRIYYTHIDAFGQYQFEMTECTFKQDPQKGFMLDRVFFNQVKEVTEKDRLAGKGRLYEVKKEFIDLFNTSKSASSIMSQNPDTEAVLDRGFRF